MNANEYGIDIKFNVNFVLTGAVTLSLAITKPDGTALTVVPTIGLVTYGSFAANEYAIYRTQLGDIDQAGTYTARLTYNDALPSRLISDIASFTVNP